MSVRPGGHQLSPNSRFASPATTNRFDQHAASNRAHSPRQSAQLYVPVLFCDEPSPFQLLTPLASKAVAVSADSRQVMSPVGSALMNGREWENLRGMSRTFPAVARVSTVLLYALRQPAA